jgi:hypothetical protein
LLDLCTDAGGVKILGTRFGAIHNRMAAIQTDRVLERIEPLTAGTLMKNLFFLGTDAVLHSTGGRNRGRLGVHVHLLLGA